MKKISIVVALCLITSGALAQTAIQRAAQRNDINNPNKKAVGFLAAPEGSLGDVLSKFDAVQMADLTTALAYANAANDTPAIRCYTTWLQTVKTLQTVRDDNPPGDGPQLITTFQKARNMVKMMDTDQPLRMDCAALAADAKKDVRGFISDIVTGVALKALTGGLIP